VLEVMSHTNKIRYQLPTGRIVSGLNINTTTYTSHTFVRPVKNYNNFEGGSYSSNRGSWEKIIAPFNYKIHSSKRTSKTLTKDNILLLPTGTQLKLSELYGFIKEK
jgi:hypothetical protein